jgi:hypothetical protein
MFRKILLTTVFFLLVMVSAKAASAAAEEDNCRNKVMYVSNQVAVNLWVKRDRGDCFLLKKHKIFKVFPRKTLHIYSDSTCRTEYCTSLRHEDFKSFDQNGDCRVRILTGCTLSDT